MSPYWLFPFLSSLQQPLYATTLPSNQDLQVITDFDGAPVDKNLTAWVRDYAEIKPTQNLKPQEFQKIVAEQDQFTSTYLLLRSANLASKPDKSTINLVKDIIDILRSERGEEMAKHPLYSLLMQEVIDSNQASNSEQAYAAHQLRTYGDRSCPSKALNLREIGPRISKDNSVESINQVLDELLRHKSLRFRREALEVFFDALPTNRQNDVRSKLQPVVKEIPSLFADNEWLLNDDTVADKSPLSKDFAKGLRTVEQNANRKNCRTAKVDLLNLVDRFKSETDAFGAVEKTSIKLEECFQRKGPSARSMYWTQMEKPLGSAFGFRGSELARRKLASLYWSRNDFANARRIFSDLLDESIRQSNRDIEQNILFTLARVDENEGKLEVALENYQRFTEKFPESEKYMDAKMAMVLLNSVLRNYALALASAEDIVTSQSKLDLDKRSTSGMSFALFWAGRLNLALGKKNLTQHFWERAANEYYSTFYGAIGHFLLEKLEGKPLVLPPAKTAGFDENVFFGKFATEDQPTLQRIRSLLHLGLRTEASCEIQELVSAPDEFDKLAFKALLQHASGDWLSSIKTYDALPRSFRNRLPAGFERLLFPRAFDSQVDEYAKKIGIDPDLIFAIIRQESVFNPRANSIAGARGLMQLMPGTARLELKQLGTGYADGIDRLRLRRSFATDNGLFDADVNIALGVQHVSRLLKKYQNPVFVLSSYNANPRATERWIQNIPSDDFLGFIERIPYAETRTYVKLVLRNYFYYKRWYRTPLPEMFHLEDIAKNVMHMVDATVKPEGG